MSGHSNDTFHHVRDYPYFEVPGFLTSAHAYADRASVPWYVEKAIHADHMSLEQVNEAMKGKVLIPQPFAGDHEHHGFVITKFMVLQVVAVLIVFAIARGLARRVSGGRPVSGRWWNFWEMLSIYLRDNVVRPTIGTGHHGHDDHGHDDHGHGDHGHGHAHAAVEQHAHPADKYLPFVWSCFFYVLICNLLGALPWLGSPTGEINVTGVLAVVAFGATIYYGSEQLGFGGFWKALCPHMDVPGALKPLLIPMIWSIELLGLFIKHGVLAVRLFANIMAGHTVVAVFLGFIAMFGADEFLFYVVTPASIFAQVGVGLLELFVAFLQAYIFAFLATLFIGTAVHPH